MGLATTNARLAAAVLDSLEGSGLEFAVLHGEEAIAAGDVTSDLDVVVAIHPIAAVAQAAAQLESAGLFPVIVWDYDVGGTATVLLATRDASEGVQLDLMYDPSGRGKYGARTGPMLASRVSGVRWPTVGDEHRIAYLIRKRHVKGDEGRLNVLLSEARQIFQPQFMTLVRETFSRRVADSIQDLVDGRGSARRVPYPGGYRFRNAWRRAKRILHPTGFWVEIADESAAEAVVEVAERFKRFLPAVAVGVRPSGLLARIGWILSIVAPVRWRAGVYLSGGFGWPRGDLRLAALGDLDILCSQIVHGMNTRLRP